ncbi:MAG TPA: serine hydrolase [Actinomycetota bacterium]|nr:serine hydrolase [Actinomycetota bacterium]
MDKSTACLAALVALVLGVAFPAPGDGGTARSGWRAGRLTCAACLVVDDTGTRLFGRRAGAARAPASTTKMVTALLVSRRARRGAAVTVSARAASTGGGGLDLVAGDRFTVGELLHALLLTSSNDASVALAEHAAGSEAAFVSAMNRLARRLGARATHFVTPHGLDRSGHVSTAADLVLIARALLRDPYLARIVATPRVTIQGPEGSIPLENRNALLETYRGAIGVKTGFTDEAGEVLVAAARRGGRELIAVAMGSRNAARDCRRLLDRGFELLRTATVVAPRHPVGTLVFDPAGSVPVVAGERVRGMWRPASIGLRFHPDPEAEPPLARGVRVGTVVVSARGRPVASVPAVAAGGLEVGGGRPLLGALGALLRIGSAIAAAVGET